MSGAKRRGALRVLTWVMTAVAVAYLVHAVARDWRAMDLSLLRVRPLRLVASVLLESAALALGVAAWARLLRVTGAGVSLRSLLPVWWKASVARFIPGKVWPFVAAAGGSGATGVSGPLLAATFGVHATLALLSAAVVGVAVVERGAGEVSGVALSAVALIALLLAIHPRVAHGVVRLAERTLRRAPRAWSYRWSDGVVLVVMHVASWVAQGAALFLFVDALVEVRSSALPQIVSATALAFAGGSLLSIAPAGVGVREAALVILIAPYVPAGTAAAVALAARLWSVAAEVLLGVVAITTSRPATASREAYDGQELR